MGDAGPARFSIDRTLTDKRLLGAALQDVASWTTWRTVLKAAFGLTLNRDEARAFAAVAGSRKPPQQRVRELWAIIGRRGGKSRMAAALAVHLACFGTHRLARGEVGAVLVLAASRDQAQTVFSYIVGFLQASPILSKEIVNITAHEITLRNGILISVHANSFRTVRGRTLVACIFDEAAFWRDEASATPDVEVYRATLPSLATTNGMLIGISTPYRKLGLLHQKHRDHFGVDSDDVLVVQGSTRRFNPTLSEQTIATQRQADQALTELHVARPAGVMERLVFARALCPWNQFFHARPAIATHFGEASRWGRPSNLATAAAANSGSVRRNHGGGPGPALQR